MFEPRAARNADPCSRRVMLIEANPCGFSFSYSRVVKQFLTGPSKSDPRNILIGRMKCGE